MRKPPKVRWVLLFAVGAATFSVLVTTGSYLVAVLGASAVGALGRALGVERTALWTWTGMLSVIFLAALLFAFVGWMLWRIAYLVVEIRKLRREP
jgi:hypothetical protein